MGASRDKLTTLDLFSGAGGFSLGLELAGFRSVGAIDISEVAGQTFAANFGPRPLSRFGPKEGDLRRIRPGELSRALSKAGGAELDLLVAAPPCQGFSRIGRGKLDWMADREGAFVLDPRNHLYRQAVALLRELRPRAFLYENVAGILHVRGDNVGERVCEAVAASGYRVRAAILNSAWFGVPQSRERLFVIGVRDDLDLEPVFPRRLHSVTVTRGHFSQATMSNTLWRRPEFFVPFADLPAADHLASPVTVRQALADLPSFTGHLRAQREGTRYRPRRESMPAVSYRREPPNDYCELMRNWPGLNQPDAVTDHFCRCTPRDYDTFRRMKVGDRYNEALAIARDRYAEARFAWWPGSGPRPTRADFIPPYPDDCFDEKWRKLDPNQPAYTITAHLSKDTYSHIHHNSRQARAITMREAARLQGFPDGFAFAGNMGDMFTQIGNAVPPLLAAAVGEAILATLQEAAEPCPSTPSHRRSAVGQ
jgi:DNA (cytosine-5)-methyltransferase 1